MKTKHNKQSVQSIILGRLGTMQFSKPQQYHIALGDREANMTFGSPDGVVCGKMLEIAGEEHAGKTMIALIMAGLAQQQHGAFVINVDLDSTYDRAWTRHLGVNTHRDHFYLCQPKKIQNFKVQTKIVKINGKKKRVRERIPIGKPYLQSANHIMTEVEETVAWVKEQDAARPVFIFIDSLADVQTEMVREKGMQQNMRTNMEKALFFSQLMPRWKHWASSEDLWIVWLNQIRFKPTAFGDPRYAGGGKAKDHACHSRVWAIKLKGGQLKSSGKQIGIKGKFVNFKNKMGEGSEPSHETGFKMIFTKPIEKGFKYMSAKEAKE